MLMSSFACFSAYIISLATFLIGAPQSNPTPVVPFPDLSDPKAVAYSLAIALAKGDVEAARIAYGGNDKAFVDYLNALGETKANVDRLLRAIAHRFGEEVASAFNPSFDSELKTSAGENAGKKLLISTLIAFAEVKEEGDHAILKVIRDVEIGVTKTASGWKVTSWPGMSPMAFATLKIGDKWSRELTDDLEKGKYKTAHELTIAAHKTSERISNEMFKTFAPDEEKKRDKR
jgi:hypothetical protein